ncbi:hypothetical protein Hanom_Chr10g00909721 [Helianthus anomalus]
MAFVAEVKQSREVEHARAYLDKVYDAHKEARRANRWSREQKCYVDPKGNPKVDPDAVDFDALVAAIPTVGKKKKKTVKEIVAESQKLVKDEKKEKVADESVEKLIEVAVAEKQPDEEDQKKKAKDADVSIAEVKIQTESSEMSDKSDHKTDQQCKKEILNLLKLKIFSKKSVMKWLNRKIFLNKKMKS